MSNLYERLIIRQHSYSLDWEISEQTSFFSFSNPSPKYAGWCFKTSWISTRLLHMCYDHEDHKLGRKFTRCFRHLKKLKDFQIWVNLRWLFRAFQNMKTVRLLVFSRNHVPYTHFSLYEPFHVFVLQWKALCSWKQMTIQKLST